MRAVVDGVPLLSVSDQPRYEDFRQCLHPALVREHVRSDTKRRQLSKAPVGEREYNGSTSNTTQFGSAGGQTYLNWRPHQNHLETGICLALKLVYYAQAKEDFFALMEV